MDKADIPFLTVAQLSELIKNRTVSPVQAVEAYLDRIDSLNVGVIPIWSEVISR